MIVNKYISINNKSNDSAEILIYGDIADSKWYDDDVTPKEIYQALSSFVNIKTLDVRICSYGGSVFAGNAIYSILNTFKEKNGVSINVYIDGIAASMATGISAVGDKVYISENGTFMIHDPIASVTGNANDFKKGIELLEHAKETLISNYMHRFNAGEEKLRALMEAESWLTAEEAKNYGFVDEITGTVKIAASANGIKIGDQTFGKNVADMIKNKYPNMKLKKEENALDYDAKLGEYGITQDLFDTLNVASDKILEIVNLVKDSVKPEPVAEFIGKETALAELGCEDITAEEVFAYAKAGMHPADTTEISNKAAEYDKIVDSAKETALTWAQKAQGESYNEGRMKKYLAVLDYSEIVAQTDSWKEEAKNSLHAGKRVSSPEKTVENSPVINVNDYRV